MNPTKKRFKRLSRGYASYTLSRPPLTSPQNKEAEAKEELKRRAKQLEHQRREQQRIQRAQGPAYPSGGTSYSSGSGGGIPGGYAPISNPTLDRERDAYATPRTSSPAFSSKASAAPAFKGSGMKLGEKRGANAKRDEYLAAMGGLTAEPEVEQVHEVHEPESAARVQADEHVLPEVEKQRCVGLASELSSR